MSGPEHYREAERLLSLALEHQQTGMHARSVDICNTQAQVHATLALAAATIDAAAHPNQSQVDYLGHWWEAGV